MSCNEVGTNRKLHVPNVVGFLGMNHGVGHVAQYLEVPTKALEGAMGDDDAASFDHND